MTLVDLASCEREIDLPFSFKLRSNRLRSFKRETTSLVATANVNLGLDIAEQ